MTEASLQFVITLENLPQLSPTSFVVKVGLKEVGRVYRLGTIGGERRWVWSVPIMVAGVFSDWERSTDTYGTRMEAVWALLAARYESVADAR